MKDIQTPEFSVWWTRNIYSQVVWQMYQAQTHSGVQLLNLLNVVWQIA
jgi:hypothetical protein